MTRIDDFRDEDLFSRYKVALLDDMKNMSIQNTVVQCPLCGAEYFNVIVDIEDHFFVIECSCKMQYAYPRPSESVLMEYYKSSESNRMWHEIMVSTSDKRRDAFREHIIPLIPNPKGKWLDIGCGPGYFLDVLKEKYPEVETFGYDWFFDDDFLHKSVTEIPTSESFDFVSLLQVLEHVVDPVNTLESCKKALKPDGVLFVTVPNYKGFDSSALSPYDREWEIPQHINYFCVDTALACVSKAGYEVSDFGTFGRLDVDIVRNKLDVVDNDFVKLLVNSNSKTTSEFQEFLKRNNLSGQLYIVAKNKQ